MEEEEEGDESEVCHVQRGPTVAASLGLQQLISSCLPPPATRFVDDNPRKGCSSKGRILFNIPIVTLRRVPGYQSPAPGIHVADEVLTDGRPSPCTICGIELTKTELKAPIPSNVQELFKKAILTKKLRNELRRKRRPGPLRCQPGANQDGDLSFCTYCTNVLHELQKLQKKVSMIQDTIQDLTLCLKSAIRIRIRAGKKLPCGELPVVKPSSLTPNQIYNESETTVKQEPPWEPIIAESFRNDKNVEDLHEVILEVPFEEREMEVDDPLEESINEYEEMEILPDRTDVDSEYEPEQELGTEQCSSDSDYKPQLKPTIPHRAKKSKRHGGKQIAPPTKKQKTSPVLKKRKKTSLKTVNPLSTEQLQKYSASKRSIKAKKVFEPCHMRNPSRIAQDCQCSHCEKVFKFELTLLTHINRRHREELQHQCDQCNKQYYTKPLLDTHRKVHSSEIGERDLVCEICQHTSSTVSFLENHLTRHSGEPRYSCSEINCGQTFYTFQVMRHHMAREHSDSVKGFECPFCGMKFAWKHSYEKHVVLHQSKPDLKCPHCPKSYNTMFYLTRHIGYAHEKKEARQRKCDICGVTVHNIYGLRDHKARYHGLRPFVCTENECGETFFDRLDLYSHRNAYHASNDQAERHAKGEKSTMKPRRRRAVVRFEGTRRLNEAPSAEKPQCEECGKLFTTLLTLRIHRKRHIKNFECTVCKEAFSTSAEQKIHMWLHESKDANATLECDSCEKKFAYQISLVQHQELEHGNNPTSPTTSEEVVAKPTTSVRLASSDLLTEEPVHGNDEAGIECPLCPSRFKRQRDLLNHISMTHNDQTNFAGYDYQCEVCSKKFSSKLGLNHHIAIIHEEKQTNVCEICGKVLKSKHAYKDHMNAHNGVMPYECDICFKKFVRYNSMTSHRVIHFEERRYSCHICSQSFKRKGDCNSHIKTHNEKTNVSG